MPWTPIRLVPFLTLALACGGDDGGGSGSEQPDAGTPDAAAADAAPPASVAHCEYAPLPPTAGAGGAVEPGPVSAGAAEAPLISADLHSSGRVHLARKLCRGGRPDR